MWLIVVDLARLCDFKPYLVPAVQRPNAAGGACKLLCQAFARCMRAAT
jgi:hypothetical protein